MAEKGKPQVARTTAAFVGISKKSIEEALTNAAELAAEHGHKGQTFAVTRQEVDVANPGIGEYRVTIVDG